LDVWRGVVPEAVPFLGGRYFALFPIGNIADLAIIAGVAAIILFQRRFPEAVGAAAPASEVTTAPDGAPRDGTAVPPAEVVAPAEAVPPGEEAPPSAGA